MIKEGEMIPDRCRMPGHSIPGGVAIYIMVNYPLRYSQSSPSPTSSSPTTSSRPLGHRDLTSLEDHFGGHGTLYLYLQGDYHPPGYIGRRH